MSMLAATTATILLIASPNTTDATLLAANGGFLLGNAQRCGVHSDRVERVGRLVRNLIVAATEDTQEQEEATKEFAQFFVVSALVDPRAKKPVASCKIVTSEFGRLERHVPAAVGSNTAGGDKPAFGFRLGDGE